MQTILWALHPLPFCWKLTHPIKHDVNYQHEHVTLCAMTAWSTCDVMSSRHLSYCSHWCSFSSTRQVFSASSCFIRSSSTLVLSLPLLPTLSSECDTPLCTHPHMHTRFNGHFQAILGKTGFHSVIMTVSAGWQKGHLTHNKYTCHLPQQLLSETSCKTKENRLTHIHLVNSC